MIEKFDEFDTGWFDNQMRRYQSNKRKLEKLDKQKKAELEYVRNYYLAQANEIDKEQEIIKVDLWNYLNLYGMTSQSTAFGNAHLTTAGDKFFWKDLSAKQKREIAEKLPDEYVNREPKQGAINKNATITDDGRVVLNDTGEIIEGLTAKKGGYKTIAIRKGEI